MFHLGGGGLKTACTSTDAGQGSWMLEFISEWGGGGGGGELHDDPPVLMWPGQDSRIQEFSSDWSQNVGYVPLPWPWPLGGLHVPTAGWWSYVAITTQTMSKRSNWIILSWKDSSHRSCRLLKNLLALFP